MLGARLAQARQRLGRRLSEVDGGTRLVTRLRILYRWEPPLGALASLVLNEFGDFPMMRKMLLTLRRRAEDSDPRAAAHVALGAMH